MPLEQKIEAYNENESKEENTGKVNSQTNSSPYTNLSKVEIENIYKDINKSIDREFGPERSITPHQLDSQQILKLQSCKTEEALIATFMACFDLHIDPEIKYIIPNKELGKIEMIELLDWNVGNCDEKSKLSIFTCYAIVKRLYLENLIKALKSRAKPKEEKEKRSYTQTSTSALDINRAISGEPRCFIKTVEIPENQAACKIIVNVANSEILAGGDSFSDLLKTTSSLNFYTYHDGGIFPFSSMEQVDVISSDKIRNHLSEQHKNINDYYILDPIEWNEICNRIPTTVIRDSLSSNVHGDGCDMREKFHIRIPVDGIDTNHLNSIVRFLNNSSMAHDITLSIESKESFSSAKSLLRYLNKLNKLAIYEFYSWGDWPPNPNVHLSLPDNLKNLETLVVSIWHCKKINLSNELTNIKDILLDCPLLTELDLSGLKNLKYIRVIGHLSWQKLKLDECQNSLTFDFREAEKPTIISKGKTEPLIKALEESGFEVLRPKPKANSPDGFVSGYFPQAEWSYSDQPETLDKETAPKYVELTQRVCLRDHNGGIDPAEYRKKVLTGISINERDELVFIPYSFNADRTILVDLNSIKKEPRNQFNKNRVAALHQQVPGSYLGIESLSTETAQWIPLTGLSAKDNLVLLDQDSLNELARQHLALEVRYTDETHQYFARVKILNKSIKPIKPVVHLHYGMSPNKVVKGENVTSVENPTILNQAIGHILSDECHVLPLNDNDIDHQRHLMYEHGIFSKRGKIVEALKLTYLFFTEQEITAEIQDHVNKKLLEIGLKNESIQFLIACFFATAGVCDQRAKTYFALANYYKLPARIIHNDVHAYVEYYQNGQWNQLDLGGAHVDKRNTFDIWETLQKQRGTLQKQNERNKFLEFTISQPHNSQAVAQETEAKNEFHDHFCIDALALDESAGFERWHQSLSALKDHPLLEFSNNEEAFWLHSQMMTLDGCQNGNNYFYIHQPSDFDRLLSQLHVNSAGECHEIKGPLLKMIEAGHATILINWSHFSEKKIANYKSILDSHPTLQGYGLGPGIKIINMTQTNTKASPAFYSRTRLVAWPKTLSSVQPEQAQESINDHITDLYESRDWEGMLVGKLQIKGDSFSFIEGSLLQAIKQGHTSITLTGLPSDPSFAAFIKRIQLERGFYANGQWCDLANNFTFNLYNSPQTNLIASMPQFHHRSDEHSNHYYINRQNYTTLFARYIIDDHGKATSLKGLIEEMPPAATIVLTDALDNGQIRQINAKLTTQRPDIKLTILPHLQTKKETTGELMSRDYPAIHARSSASSVIISDDINTAARMLDEQETMVINISEVTEFSDLFEKTSLDTRDTQSPFGQKKLRFKYQALELLKHLETGDKVILKGNISTELYHQIETLFSKQPYLIINGQYIKMSGVISLITSAHTDTPHLFDSAVNQYRHAFNWDNAQAYLQTKMKLSAHEANETILRIKRFYDEASQITHNGKTTPPKLTLTADEILQLAQAMKDNAGSNNPIKHFFHLNYTEDKEVYARLCVIAKIHLNESEQSYDVDAIKLRKLVDAHQGKIELIKWQILNCFSPTYLQNHYDEIENADNLEQIMRFVASLREKTKSTVSRHVKQIQLVENILKTSPFVELRGEPGTGKTHFIKHEIESKNDVDPYWGEENIIAWLTDPDSKNVKKYLLIDEANMKEPGYWDFLKGLSTNKIHYKGHSYKVSSNTHKVIFTGNPESYPGRHYHSFLEQLPKVYFKPHTPEYLKDNIILPRLSEHCSALSAEKQHIIADVFIKAYSLVKKELPFETVSIRDLKSMLDYFLTFATSENKLEIDAKVYLAIIQTFTGLFKNTEDREQFIQTIKQYFQIDNVILEQMSSPDTGYILPSSRQLLWHMVNQCLNRSKMAIEKGKPLPRIGLLVEGPSGIGKSEMMLQALKHQGYVAYSNDTDLKMEGNRIYFHISMGSENISEIIKKAYDLDGYVAIVIDELNLLTQKNERLLIQLMEEKHSICILSSQNSQLYAGRKPLSYALLNRFDRFYEKPHSRDDLLEICDKSNKFLGHQQAEQFVDRFLEQCDKHPEKINVRNFFDAIASRSVCYFKGDHQDCAQMLNQSGIFTGSKPDEYHDENQYDNRHCCHIL